MNQVNKIFCEIQELLSACDVEKHKHREIIFKLFYLHGYIAEMERAFWEIMNNEDEKREGS